MAQQDNLNAANPANLSRSVAGTMGAPAATPSDRNTVGVNAPILARGVASPNIVHKDRSGTHYLQPVLIQHRALSGGHYIPPTSKRRI